MSDLERDVDAGSGRPPPGTPAWVKIFAIVVLLVILIVLVALLLGGSHGPGRHS